MRKQRIDHLATAGAVDDQPGVSLIRSAWQRLRRNPIFLLGLAITDRPERAVVLIGALDALYDDLETDMPAWEREIREDIVAEAEDGREALRRVVRERPDLLITDYSMPLLNGVEVTQRAKKQSPDTKVLVFTDHERETVFKEALGAGALGFVLKREPNDVLLRAVAPEPGYGLAFLEGSLMNATQRETAQEW